MVNRKFFLSAVLCLAVLATVLQAVTGPSVFVLPNGLGGTNDAATIYAADPFQSAAVIHADARANLALETPSGSKYYVISNSGSNTVSVFDGNSNVLLRQMSLGTQAVAAAMSVTPSWVRLLVLTSDGTLHVLDSASDTEIGRVTVGASPVDVAVSRDGLRAFVAAAGQLLPVDLTTNAIVAGGISIGGTLTGVAVAPGGLVYASASNQVLEVDGSSMILRASISTNAAPGRLSFTPDGTRAVAVNQTPATGSVAVLFDLANRVQSMSIASFGPTLNKVVVVNNNLAYATSNNQTVYQLTLNPFNIAGPTFNSIGSPTGVTDMAKSNEVPSARFLFLTTMGNLVYRVDLTGGQTTGTQVASTSAGAISYVAPAATGSAGNILAYNTNQTVALGAATLPLVVRVTDVSGKPLSGIPVTFTTSGGVILQTPSTVTNQDGFAQTAATAPYTVGVASVYASAAGLYSSTFNVNVGTTGGGGTGTGTTQLQIIAGNGQVVSQSFATTVPLTVKVTDANNLALPYQTVTWTLISGSATIYTTATATDANGVTSVSAFGAAFVNPFSRYDQSTIVATIYTGASVSFTVTTIANQTNGFPGTLTAVRSKPTLSNATITGAAGTTVTGAIQVLVGDSSGQPIPNVGLSATTGLDPKVGPTATCKGSGNVALTDATGTANCDLALGGIKGQAPLNINVGGQINLSPLTLVVTSGLPGQLVIVQGNNQSGNAGQTLPLALKAQVTDAFGNALSGVQVQWTVTSGSATLGNVVSVSDSNGYVSALPTLGSSAGNIQITVTALTGTGSATFTVTANITAVGLQAVSGGGQSAITNQAFSQPLVVLAADAKSSPVQGLAISFAVTSGSASLSPSPVNTDAAGRAQVSVTAGGTAGPVVVTASSGNLSTTFTLTVNLPGPVVAASGFLNAAGFQQGVVPGSLVYITGAGLAPGIQDSVMGNNVVGALPTTLASVQVQFGSILAPIYAVSNINGQESVIVQVPFEVPVGSSSVTIKVGGGSTTVTVPVSQYQPGIFESMGSDGRRYAAVLRPDGSWVSPSNPAQRGETVKVLVTGLGQVSPAAGTNKAGTGGQNVVAPILLGVNNAGVSAISAEYAQDLIGVYVITFQVPSNASGVVNLAVALGPDGARVFGNSSLIAIQ